MTMKHTQSGFTIPEVLIAVAILASIAVLIAPILRTTTATALRVEAGVEEAEIIRLDRALLTNLLGNSFALPKTEDISETSIGSSSLYQFGTYDASGQPVRVSLKAEQGQAGITLNMQSLNGKVLIHKEHLFSPIEGVRIAYFGWQKQQNTLDWQPSWQDPYTLRMVRISGKSKKNTPIKVDFTVAGHAPLICEFDPVSRLCRID